jgi:DNA-binding winged helix-turn-helix (wHTH) protein
MRLQFGRVTFDPDCRQLWRDGHEQHLSPKAFDLLKLLVERRPEAVAKTEILTRLWPGTFVSDTNIPTLIAEIRAALGEQAHRSRLIRTLHGFGYAFRSETEISQPTAATAQQPRGWLVGESRQIALFAGENLLGREGGDVIVLGSSTVSRRHARIVIDGRRIAVEDLASKNGTYVNECRVTSSTMLGDGDRLRTGSLVFTFQRARPGSSTETQTSRGGSSGV